MQQRLFLLCLMLVFTVFVTVACSNQSNGSDAQNNEIENEASSQDNENEANDSNSDDTQNEEESDSGLNDDESSKDESNSDNDETTNTDSSASSSNDELPESIELDEEVQEGGVTLTLEDITFKDDHILVSFNAKNTRGHGIDLASEGRAEGEDLGGITLKDDTGNAYRYIADPSDHRITLMDREKVTGTVSFEGRIQGDAKSLTLVFNPNESSDRAPEFSFEDIEIEW